MNSHLTLIALAALAASLALPAAWGAAPARGTYPRLEASFELSGLASNPFDYTENDVQVTFARQEGGRATVPAFFDGGATWRVRFTPTAPGRYTIEAVTLNGKPAPAQSLAPREFTVTGKPSPGFIRRDPKALRFLFDDGQPYFPIGCNVGWSSRTLDVPGHFTKLGATGINWSRVWMTHFDGRNLEWKVAPGQLDLDAARKWDAIVETAEKQGIHFQLALQHHGQYSSSTNPNWPPARSGSPQNPWNKANGGWLDSAAEFFTDERAVALTKMRYRYVIARWGYSPAIMAWELFNEVQYVDAERTPEGRAAVSRWHSEMAAFLRRQDPYHHLITTSSDLSLDIWKAMDYYQAHSYPPDIIGAVASFAARKMDKPFFIGEMGPGGGASLAADDGAGLHQVLWAGMMSGMAGAAQYWTWDTVERNDLYSHFRAATGFLRASGMASVPGLRPANATAETGDLGTLRFAPTGGFLGTSGEATIQANGEVTGLAGMTNFLHGQNHRAQSPDTFTFHVSYPEAGTFVVRIGQVAKAGAHLTLSVDGTAAAEHDYAAAERDYRGDFDLEASVAAGKHTVTIRNTGRDWVQVGRIELSPYVPALGVLGRSSGSYAALWLYSRAARPGASGTLAVPGLQAGTYTVTWWDTYAGKPLSQASATVKAGQPLRLPVPPIERDAAVWIAR